MTGLEIPLPTDSPYNDPGQYTPLLLSAIGVFLLSPDIWLPEEYPDARGYMNDLMAYIVELMEQGIVPGTPVGAIMLFPTSAQPDNWLICNGGQISRTEYPDLFALLGTDYGVGNGTTTFNLPNYVGYSPMGQGEIPELGDTLGFGGTMGTYFHTLTTAQIPAHTHGFERRTTNGAGATFSALPGQVAAASDGVTKSTGGGLKHPNLHPVVGVAFLIYAGLPA